MPDDMLVFNGIDGDTGAYDLPGHLHHATAHPVWPAAALLPAFAAASGRTDDMKNGETWFPHSPARGSFWKGKALPILLIPVLS